MQIYRLFFIYGETEGLCESRHFGTSQSRLRPTLCLQIIPKHGRNATHHPNGLKQHGLIKLTIYPPKSGVYKI